jgi:c-di-GMP-binding flagellar brake protein YcgR
MIFKKIFDGHERRKFVRLQEPLPIRFKLLDKNNSTPILDWKECTAHDISRGGICLEITGVEAELKKLLTAGSNVFQLEITLPLKKVTIKGNVYYVKVLGETMWNHFRKEILEIGVQFTEINSEDENIISNFIVQKYLEKYGV